LLTGSGPAECPSDLFMCQDKSKCIEVSKLCDRRLDCLDGSDENIFCVGDGCDTKSCEYKCKMSPDGPRCYCPVGGKLVNNTCVG
jgi:hypothetical protein